MKRFAAVLAVALPFVWAGMVIGISFIETPLKFTAPDVTLEIGLGIGQVVLKTLNRIEIVLLLFTGVAHVLGRTSRVSHGLVILAALMLIAQTVWLYPILDERTAQTIAGNKPPGSYHHIVFIVMEGVKLLALLGAGFAAGFGLLPKETKA